MLTFTRLKTVIQMLCAGTSFFDKDTMRETGKISSIGYYCVTEAIKTGTLPLISHVTVAVTQELVPTLSLETALLKCRSLNSVIQGLFGGHDRRNISCQNHLASLQIEEVTR